MIVNLKNLRDSYLSEKNILNPCFYDRDTSLVARELLGKVLVKELPAKSGSISLSGIITETEAYYGKDDTASHASGGRTPRSEIMFGRAGMAYVYLCYGMYYLLNAVTEKIDIPGAVLIRAVRPIDGLEPMLQRRNISVKGIEQLADGPGKLTIAFGIDISDNKKDLASPKSDLKIYDSFLKKRLLKIMSSPRIGVSSAKEKYLRYSLMDVKFIF